MSTVLASFLALCVADAPPAAYDGVVLAWGGAACVQPDVQPGVVGRRPARILMAQPTTVRPRIALPRMARVVSGDDQDQAAPKAWIGVRLAPVPEALAAHLDRTGLMVANVAKGSPADAAGLERYDIIVAFDGIRTESGEALVEAIADVGPGKQAQITVIHGGAERDLRITPTSVPDMASLEYKYADPQPPVVDDQTSIRGHTLKIGPDGQLQLEDLGRLDNLPEMLKRYYQFDPNRRLDLQPIFPRGWQDWKFDIGDLDPGGLGDANFQLQIQTSENGETLMVRRDVDGKITVERTDADGKTTSSQYEDADALEKGDAEAHAFYSRHAGGMRWLHVQPRIGDLPKLQQEFREQLERQMQDIREQADKLRRESRLPRRQPAAPAGQSEPAQGRTRVETRSQSGAGGSSVSEALSVIIDEDGRITVKVTRNGNKAEYTFTDEADFKARQPDLFERYRKMTE